MRWFLLSGILAGLLTGCYRMPEEGYLSTVPITNNPRVVPQKNSTPIPTMNY